LLYRLLFGFSFLIPSLTSGEPAIAFSYAGSVGRAIEPVLRPLGFNWQIGVALIPGFAAREVMVSALGTVYAVEQKGDADSADGSVLGGALAKQWSLATALSLLAWYVFSCQCLSTLAVARRETNSWRWPMAMFLYMTVLAYVGSFLTYRMAIWLGWG
jgi:ferrous iron transport protein B